VTARYLADTSVLARMPKPAVAGVVEPLILDGAVAVSAVVLLEMLRFTRSPADHQRLATNLAGLPRVTTTEDLCQRALDVQRELAARSEHRGVKVPDLLIAAAAEAAGLTVLHYDADYDRIAAVTDQGAEWVVPRGSVD
jgi:predicted nucleic acid-binding protein